MTRKVLFPTHAHVVNASVIAQLYRQGLVSDPAALMAFCYNHGISVGVLARYIRSSNASSDVADQSDLKICATSGCDQALLRLDTSNICAWCVKDNQNNASETEDLSSSSDEEEEKKNIDASASAPAPSASRLSAATVP